MFGIFFSGCVHSQKPERRLIGQCEGCEAVFEYGDRNLSPVDTLPGFGLDGQKIRVQGTVYQPDGETPAEGVILYVYQTNQEGLYEPAPNAEGWGKKHGHIRGWIETGPNGQYAFYTVKPAAYPNRTEPAHIHLIVLEPDGKYYWLGSYHFAGDPLLTEKELNPKNPRGGSSGVLNLVKEGQIWLGERDIVLGENVPGYK